MKELQQILRIHKSMTPAVLATLVHIEGSSYRRVGARLLYNADGRRIGSISGGCLEEDIMLRAQQVLADGKPQVAIYDTTSENDLVWGVGLGCHGIVHVVLERIADSVPAFDLLDAAWRRREPAVIATAFSASATIQPGALAFVSATQAWCRSNDLSAASARAAASVLQDRRSHAGELAGASVLWEYVAPPLHLHVFGAGDDAQPLVRMAKELGWLVNVIDPRSAFATHARFPEADAVAVAAPESAASLAFDSRSVAVVMTHHYRFDVPLLRAILPKRLPYVGLLGPKKRAEKILGDLSAEGIVLTPEMRANFHAPVGLDLGAGTPEQVALAILAEIEAAFNQRDARPLRERTRPIHS